MDYTQEVRTVLAYVEEHLYEELSLEELAQVANMSKFHFHKLFKQQVGRNIYQYVRGRRLTNSSSLLLHSEIGILQLSLLSGFSSQAAFSRAFKELYGLPPYKYRQTFKYIQKRGIVMTEQEINGWLISGSSVDKYQVSLDREIFHQGTQSVKISSQSELLDPADFGTIMQQFQGTNYLGKRVKFSACIKAENLTGWAGLWLRMDGKASEMLRFDNMQERPITGTSEWNYYFSVLDVPFETEIINIGVLQQGPGTIWIDSVAFEEVDQTVATTDFQVEEIYPSEPVNLSFDE